jgi:hypothetical protein
MRRSVLAFTIILAVCDYSTGDRTLAVHERDVYQPAKNFVPYSGVRIVIDSRELDP